MRRAAATLLRRVLAAALMGGAAAHAHDSWLVPGDGGQFTLVTGSRYPRVELTAPPESIAARNCTTRASARACWVELREFEIELEPGLVEVYFRDAQPPAPVREHWRSLHADGHAWHERYRKFARVEETKPGVTREQLAAIRQPVGLALELVPAGDEAMQAGRKARLTLLSEGKPLAGQPVELVSERSPLGLWARTDARGEVEWTLPFTGAWLARTIVIEPDGAANWRSRFATLAFEAR